jgi:hypothetical protein
MPQWWPDEALLGRLRALRTLETRNHQGKRHK